MSYSPPGQQKSAPKLEGKKPQTAGAGGYPGQGTGHGWKETVAALGLGAPGIHGWFPGAPPGGGAGNAEPLLPG